MSQVAGVRAELAAIVGAAAVSERPVGDLWPRALMRRRAGAAPVPVLVARPQAYEEVCALLAWAGRSARRLVPAGAATGVCGAVAPGAHEVVLDLTAFDQVLAVDEVNLTCRVQAGVVGLRLEERLQRQGLTLGHFPSSLPFSTVGGLLATRSSGQQSTYYGSAEDLVLGLTVALPDGSLAGPLPGPRSAVGPPLQQLMVGSEGGLGVILEALLKIHRAPEAVVGAGFGFAGVEAGLQAMRRVMQSGIRPFVLRLYDPEDTAFQGLEVDGCLLVIAVAGPRRVADAGAAAVRDLVQPAAELGEEPWRHWLNHRFSLSADRLRAYLEAPNSYLDTIEVATGWRELPALYGDLKRIVTRDSAGLCHFSHAYPQGCCAYFTFAGGASSEAEAEARYDAIWADAMAACRARGATISHHHGVGQVRAPWARAELGGWWQVWTALRAGLDPAGVMNPVALGGSGG